MSPERWQLVKRLVESALEKEVSSRRVFLSEACGGDVDLRAEAESLIAAHDSDPAFLEDRIHVGSSAISLQSSRPFVDTMLGRRIGAYQTTRLIASGGMGAVYAAIRADDAYRKQVAIKIIRTDALWTSSHQRELMRRFVMERQTLASLEHPNIARLLDGGATEEGLPYLVMEYVEGQPIDGYCDEARLPTATRLELFLSVCSAVSHAHQRLVVHRDLKPGNILVAPDGTPKLLDFGLAKLLEPDPAALSHGLTRTGLQPMTPAYASPEQIRSEPISTSSDVYSLGVVLYELLTGQRPYPIIGAAPHEVARMICEHEPLPPSAAIGQAGLALAADGRPRMLTPDDASASRDGRLDLLRRRLRGDIDAIVLAALSKEPGRRYLSVEQLARDIRNHLDGKPISARRSTLGYRAGKFVRRHQVGVTAAGLVLLSLVGGLVGTMWMAREAERQKQVAEQVAEFWKDFYRPPDLAVDWSRRSKQAEITLETLLSGAVERIPRLDGEPLVQAELLETLGGIYNELFRYADALPLWKEALRIRRESVGPADSDTLRLMNNVGFVLQKLGRWAEAKTLLAEVVDTDSRVLGRTHRQTRHAISNLATAVSKLGELDEAEALFREALAGYPAQSEDEEKQRLGLMSSFAIVLLERGLLDEAEIVLRETFEGRTRLLGPDHARTLTSTTHLAKVLLAQGKLQEAEDLSRKTFATCRRTMRDTDSLTLLSGNTLAACLIGLGRLDEAESILVFVVGQAEAAGEPEELLLAESRGEYGRCLVQQGRCDDARAQFASAESIVRSRLPAGHPLARMTLARMAEYHDRCGDPALAAQFRAQLQMEAPAE